MSPAKSLINNIAYGVLVLNRCHFSENHHLNKKFKKQP